MIDYKQQYLILKHKYLQSKDNTQVGGKIFQKDLTLYIVATPTDEQLIHTIKQITDKLIAKNIAPYRAPHITMFQLTLNAENPDIKMFQEKQFYDKIRKIYDRTLANPKESQLLESYQFPRDYSLSGYRPGHFLRNYRQLDPKKILDFRNQIYDLIENILGKPTIKDYENPRTGTGYKIYSYNKQPLFATTNYHLKSWAPHINFLNDFDIQKHNPKLYDKLKTKSGVNKTNILRYTIRKIPKEALETINMAKQTNGLTLAIKAVGENVFVVKL